MARLDTQDIPPEYLPVYAKFMGATYLIAHGGTIHVNQTQLARTRPPEHREPPLIPSPAQRALRLAFTLCQQMLGAMPRNEAHGYFNASRGTGYGYKHFYTHRNLGPIYRGTDPATIPRPNTWTSEPEDAWHAPNLLAYFTTPGPLTLHYDFELDPGTWKYWSGEHTTSPYEIYIRNVYDGGSYDVKTFIATFDPTTRTRFTGTLTLPEGVGEVYDRRVQFIKQINENDRHAIAWRFEIPNSNAQYYGWYFTHWT